MWFLERIAEIVAAEEEVCRNGLPRDAEGLRRLKAMGFSDKRLAYLALQSANLQPGTRTATARGSWLLNKAVLAMNGGVTKADVRALRYTPGVRTMFRTIDTCAAEFMEKTPYLYSSSQTHTFG